LLVALSVLGLFLACLLRDRQAHEALASETQEPVHV
jgi:hypothetical protein